MENYDDPDIRLFTDWLLGFMPKNEWANRRNKIEDIIEGTVTGNWIKFDKGGKPVSVYEDRIGWYIYLAEVAMTDMIRYEPIQGARVLPLFRVLGEHFDKLTSIENINKKAREMIKQRKAEADACLFEMLVGTLWVRNGWKVSMVPAKGGQKSADLKATKLGEEWTIECKRLSQSSDYSKREREKWLRMVSFISPTLIEHNFLLDITFHVELLSLPDTFLFDQLNSKLSLVTHEVKVCSNEIWDVQVSFVNMFRIHQHLEKFMVKFGSPQMNELISGKRDSNRGFTSGLYARNSRHGGGKGFNVFIEAVDNAYGIRWSCDAEAAIEAKARDVRQQVKDALKQFPESTKAAVHIGIETYDGAEVEMRRFQKINQSMWDLGVSGKHLHWIFCNFFQTYAPPEQCWVIDESQYQFKNIAFPLDDPIPHKSLIVPWEMTAEDNLHWFKQEP